MHISIPMNDHPSKTLAAFAATLRFEDIPEAVVRRAEDLFLDWFGSALAGKGASPAEAIERFARRMGPAGEQLRTHRIPPALRGDSYASDSPGAAGAGQP